MGMLSCCAQEHAVLVNAHYDSALGTAAASDDLANVAIMLELLQMLAMGEGTPYGGQGAREGRVLFRTKLISLQYLLTLRFRTMWHQMIE